MTIVKPPPQLAAAWMRARGKLTLPATPDHPNGRKIVIQGATDGNHTHHDPDGKPILIVDLVPPTDRKSQGQLAQRDKLRRANAAWHAMTPAQREQYRPAARARRITLYNAALSALMLKE